MSLNAVDIPQQQQESLASCPNVESSTNSMSVSSIVTNAEPTASLELLSHADNIKVKVSSILNRSAEFAGKVSNDCDLH